MLRAMSHEYNISLFPTVLRKLPAQYPHHLSIILHIREQRFPAHQRLKLPLKLTDHFHHPVIFKAPDHMGRLCDHLRKSLAAEPLQRLLHMICLEPVPLPHDLYDRRAGKCPAEFMFRECLPYIPLNRFNILFPGLMITGPEADHQNCFFLHSLISCHKNIRSSRLCTQAAAGHYGYHHN